MRFINCTPHTINLNDGREFPVSDHIARVSSSYTEFVNDMCTVVYGEVVDLPEPQEDTMYIVSAFVLNACPERKDLVIPATGHPDCIRNEGRIVSVPGFIR